MTSFESIHPLAGQLPSSVPRWGPGSQTTFAVIVEDAAAADWVEMDSSDEVAVDDKGEAVATTLPH